jgi:hypothetical protein
MRQNARTVIAASVSAPSTMVRLSGNVVADTVTGTRNRKLNGFSSPPVR